MIVSSSTIRRKFPCQVNGLLWGWTSMGHFPFSPLWHKLNWSLLTCFIPALGAHLWFLGGHRLPNIKITLPRPSCHVARWQSSGHRGVLWNFPERSSKEGGYPSRPLLLPTGWNANIMAGAQEASLNHAGTSQPRQSRGQIRSLVPDGQDTPHEPPVSTEGLTHMGKKWALVSLPLAFSCSTEASPAQHTFFLGRNLKTWISSLTHQLPWKTGGNWLVEAEWENSEARSWCRMEWEKRKGEGDDYQQRAPSTLYDMDREATWRETWDSLQHPVDLDDQHPLTTNWWDARLAAEWTFLTFQN